MPYPTRTPPGPSNPGAPGDVRRPDPHPLRRRLRDWIRWFGAARLVTGALAAATLVVAGVWILHTPPASGGANGPTANPAAGPGLDGPLVPEVTLVGRPPETVAPRLVVHVAGAVVDPGLHELPGDARVGGAITAAGGATAEAVLDAINLAAPLVDGQRIYVPTEHDPVHDPVVLEMGADDAGGGSGPPRLIDLNRASALELEELPGVGPATAAAIVEHREARNGFGAVEDLLGVRGIGPAKFEAIRPLVTV